MPSMPFILRSVTTTCGRCSENCASARSPLSIGTTSYPAACKRMEMRRSRPGSSTISLFLFFFVVFVFLLFFVCCVCCVCVFFFFGCCVVFVFFGCCFVFLCFVL